jgi:hypothetical protein
MADRAAPLAALAIGISAFLWSDFLHEFDLPIGFTSGSVLAALPALLAVVCGATIVLFLYFVLPALALVSPITKNGSRIVDLMARPPLPPGTIGPARATTAEKSLFRYWVGWALGDVLVWGAVIWWGSTYPKRSIIWGLGAVALTIAVQTFVGWRLTSKLIGEPKRATAGFASSLLLAQVIQGYVGFFVLSAVLQSTSSSDEFAVVVAVLVMIAVMVGIALLQLIVGDKVSKGWYPNVLKHAVCGTLFALAGISVVPPIGARLTSFALISTSTPMKLCTVFVIHDKQADAISKDLLAEGSANRTVQFEFVFPSDGQYYLRRHGHPGTTILDSKAVAGTLPCEAAPNQDNINDEQDVSRTTRASAAKAILPVNSAQRLHRERRFDLLA